MKKIHPESNLQKRSKYLTKINRASEETPILTTLMSSRR